jgi:predicted Zn-dependent protease
MDLQNIATHETGHGLGLDDVYQKTCSAVTMYGYSDYGETQKRTLETPDIVGLQMIYGE